MFWSLEDLSQQVGLKPDTLRRHCCAGRIAGARRVGGVWLVHIKTFEAAFVSGGAKMLAMPEEEARRPRRRLRDVLA